MQSQLFRVRIVPALVAAGADVNAQSSTAGLSCDDVRTPLLFAAEQGDTTLMRTLIEAKADQTAMDKSGNTALNLLLDAVKLEHGNVGHALLISGADVNTRNKVRSPSPCCGYDGLQRRVWAHIGLLTNLTLADAMRFSDWPSLTSVRV